MQFPFNKSLSGTLCFPTDLCGVFRACVDDLSSSVDSYPAATFSPGRFFLEENNEGNGWLIERPWLPLRVGFEDLEAPKLECGGGGRLGIPYAFSKISVSVSLDRARAGDGELPSAGFGPGSLREFGESSLLDQGGIAQLSIVNSSSQVAHKV